MSFNRNALLVSAIFLTGCAASEQAPPPPVIVETAPTQPEIPQPLVKRHIVDDYREESPGVQYFKLPSGESCFTDMSHVIEGGRVTRVIGRLGAGACEGGTTLPKNQMQPDYPQSLEKHRTEWQNMTSKAGALMEQTPIRERALIGAIKTARVIVIGERRTLTQDGNAQNRFFLGQDSETPYGPNEVPPACFMSSEGSVVETSGPVTYRDKEYNVGVVTNKQGHGPACDIGQIVMLRIADPPVS